MKSLDLRVVMRAAQDYATAEGRDVFVSHAADGTQFWEASLDQPPPSVTHWRVTPDGQLYAHADHRSTTYLYEAVDGR